MHGERLGKIKKESKGFVHSWKGEDNEGKNVLEKLCLIALEKKRAIGQSKRAFDKKKEERTI